jgi:hypothetical protein
MQRKDLKSDAEAQVMYPNAVFGQIWNLAATLLGFSTVNSY